MAVKLVRYRLSINKDCFACVAHAIMLNSIEAKKLQGIGQSVRTWLAEWERGDLHPPSRSDFAELWQQRRGDPRMVFLALTEEDAAKMAKWKEAVGAALGRKTSVPIALVAMAQAVVARDSK